MKLCEGIPDRKNFRIPTQFSMRAFEPPVNPNLCIENPGMERKIGMAAKALEVAVKAMGDSCCNDEDEDGFIDCEDGALKESKVVKDGGEDDFVDVSNEKLELLEWELVSSL